MKKIIEHHHDKLGIIGLFVITIIFAIIGVTILPKKSLAPVPITRTTQQPVTTIDVVQKPVVLVQTIKPNDRVFPKQIITGTAPGYYFFEGSFPVTLMDINNQPIGTVIATTDEDWMVTKNVGFSIVLPETFSYTGPGSLLFKKDDPSDGEAPFDPVKDQYSIPVVFEDQ